MIQIEGFTCAKNPMAQGLCEDRLVALADRCVAVVDGATDLSGRRFDGRTGGWLAAEAVAGALAAIEPLPEAEAVGAAAHAAIDGVYRRLGDTAPRDARDRFRAAFAVFYTDGAGARLVLCGDCTARVNGTEVLSAPNPSDAVAATARALLWRRLAAEGHPAATIDMAVRDAIAAGLDAPPPPPLTAAHLLSLRTDMLSDAALVARVGGAAGVSRLLSAGLRGVRADPVAFGLGGVDGVVPPGDLRSLDIDPRATLELATDGYPLPGAGPSVAAWEAAFAAVEAEDFHRIGRFASTKGSAPGRFADDRTVVIRRWAG